ncbi:IclR family transcriptional regulator [Geminicoccus roseus]|uniref:IclR family transcriptional regulator n=1 Tax=Geminicoccus roseus TaxID=404900 RepID=UPI0004179F1F|nr:IclR family transcriptional regulator [Geminicoccus roseus]
MGGAQSVDRALTLLALVGRHPDRGVGLATIVAETGLNRPTARRLLLALIRARLVEQDEASRHYFLGEEAFVLGTLASRRFGLLDLAMESLAALARESGDTSFLSVRRDNHAVCLHREEGAFPIRIHALQVGYQHPLGVGGGSLAILAVLPDEDVERVLEANQPVLAAQYPSYSLPLLRHHVALTRARGWSINPGLILPNSWAIGVAMLYPNGRPAGALSIAAIDSRMGEDRQEELGRLLQREASRVEDKLRRMFTAKPAGRRPDVRSKDIPTAENGIETRLERLAP